jgi:hypothetical protein
VKIKIFGKKNCAKCETTKNKFNHFIEKHKLHDIAMFEFFDMDTADGLAEGAFNDVLKIPTTLIENKQAVLARWDGEVPKTEDFENYFQQK